MTERKRTVLERLSHPQGNEIADEISAAYKAFEIPGYSGDEPNRVIHINGKRVGREFVKMTVDADGVHRPHYIYYYDYTDAINPNLRLGIEADRRKIQLYYALIAGGHEQITYTGNPSAEEAADFLRTMPRGPGNFGGI